MEIKKNISLKAYNTFGIDVAAAYYASFKSVADLEYALSEQKRLAFTGKRLILGGGSNVLFTKDFDGLVLKNEIPAIEKIQEDDDFIFIKAGAGVNWHQFVLYCLDNNYAGVENLALIPGNVGASPMQNIGAYGVEIKDVFYSLEAFHIEEKSTEIFKNADCCFGYRESIFKTIYKNKFVITSVTFKLLKNPVFNTSYGAIETELEKMKISSLNIQSIANAVIHIRKSKLPDPAIIGNAGSFFKNPLVSGKNFHDLKIMYPGLPGYALKDDFKVAAGWLIEQCGWKGFRKGDAGCYAKQALVLVNYGQAKGAEIMALSNDMIKSVMDKFGITLEREVNII